MCKKRNQFGPPKGGYAKDVKALDYGLLNANDYEQFADSVVNMLKERYGERNNVRRKVKRIRYYRNKDGDNESTPRILTDVGPIELPRPRSDDASRYLALAFQAVGSLLGISVHSSFYTGSGEFKSGDVGMKHRKSFNRHRN